MKRQLALFEMAEISREEFKKLELHVGTIREVDEHPNADKLYVLKVDIGEEVRQLVAALKGHYEEDELVGKKVVVLTNLKPIELRGVKSNGMVLAAVDGDSVVLLEPEQDIANGAKVH